MREGEGEYHKWMLLANKTQLPVVVQHRVGIVILRFNAKVPVFIVYPKPGLGSWRSKTTVGRVVPWHGPTGIVSALESNGIHHVGHVRFL